MASNGEVKGPINGHVILLIEGNDGERFYGDYKSFVECIDTLAEMYEKTRQSLQEDSRNYDLNKIYKWIDGMNLIEVFVFEEPINRYRRYDRVKLKDAFTEQLERLQE